MPVRRRFSSRVVAEVQKSLVIGIRAGGTAHRFIGIWVVVVDGRIFVRSWTLKRSGWHRTLLDDPRGAFTIGKRELKMRAKQVTSERLLAAVDQAYAEKYPTPGSRKYVQGFRRGRRRASTTELMPA